jgi:hypothetical protein
MTSARDSLFRERLGYAMSRGGAVATGWWLLKKLGRIDAYHILAYRDSAASLREGGRKRFNFASISTKADIELLQPAMHSELEDHSGRDLSSLVDEDATVYFIAEGRQVVCQLVISRRREIRLDVPSGVIFDIGPRTAFLSYLFTHINYRRIGAARELLEYVWKELASSSCDRVIAHVQVTNVPSLGIFAAAGWHRIGTIWKVASWRSWISTPFSVDQISIRCEPPAQSA